jgi:alpha-tubulin suppressor-like RCC1 family protein
MGRSGPGGRTQTEKLDKIQYRLSCLRPGVPPFPEKIIKLACGGYHTFFLGEKGSLWSCGWEYFGSSGHGEEKKCPSPQILFSGEGPEKVKEISAGWCHSLILLQDGSLRVWGANENGALGLGTLYPQRIYQPVELVFPPKALHSRKNEQGEGEGEGEAEREGGGEGDGPGEGEEEEAEVVGIGCNGDNSFLVTSKGDLWAWGRGDYGTTGHGTFEHVLQPKNVVGVKVRLPMPSSWGWWREVGVWLFLGREDSGSEFRRMPIEVAFHFVEMTFVR